MFWYIGQTADHLYAVVSVINPGKMYSAIKINDSVDDGLDLSNVDLHNPKTKLQTLIK